VFFSRATHHGPRERQGGRMKKVSEKEEEEEDEGRGRRRRKGRRRGK
jgi:hypothetical protein